MSDEREETAEEAEFRKDPRSRAEVDAETRAIFVRSHEALLKLRQEVEADPRLSAAERSEKLAKCDGLIEGSSASLGRWDAMVNGRAERLTASRRRSAARSEQEQRERDDEASRPQPSAWSRLGPWDKLGVLLHFLIVGWAVGMFRGDSRRERW